MNSQLIIGLTGYARSGKDTAAAMLTADHGFTRYGFADLLKKVARDIDPYVETSPGRKRRWLWPATPAQFERLADVVDRLGWEKAKEFDDVRRLLQRLGTEGGRDNLGDAVWVEPVMRRIVASHAPAVITDVRFPNECTAVQQAGGYVVRVHRPGVAAINAHPSDAGIDTLPVDLHLTNDGTVEQLHHQTSHLVARLQRAGDRLAG